MNDTDLRLYALNFCLLATHQVDAAFQREWELFGVPGGIRFFLIFNLAALLALAWGYEQVARTTRHARLVIRALMGTGALTCLLHAFFLARGNPEFSQPESLAILAAIAAVSAFQLTRDLRSQGAKSSH